MNSTQNFTSSRRSFFLRSAGLFGAGALATRIADAQTSGGTTASTDIDVLNYALYLENLEAAFYTQGIARFNGNDFAGSIYAPVFGSKIANNYLSFFTTILDHEVAHVTALTNTIRSLGGVPVSACTYNFNVNNVNDFISTAMALENTGVMAYDGAISLITNLDVKQAAATIATVEARHAAYLNVLNGSIPFPSAFDTPKSQVDVLAIAQAFVTSCPVPSTVANNPNGPIIRGLSSTVTTQDQSVSFNFSQSTDKNGVAVTFLLSQVSGGRAAITSDHTSNPTVVLLGGKGTYVFELAVTDDLGNVQRGRITVTYI